MVLAGDKLPTVMAAITGRDPGGIPPPLYIKAWEVPSDVTVPELCLASEKVSGVNSIEGAQLIKNLWRVYPLSIESRSDLLIAGVRRYFDPPIYWPRGQYIVRYFDPGVNIS